MEDMQDLTISVPTEKGEAWMDELKPWPFCGGKAAFVGMLANTLRSNAKTVAVRFSCLIRS
ncbi:MAG: hypothetical protein E7434_01690 [Ruminococcaceae bacterium]|nr:hypothetical protein [Oscillospiraceae bacterium]